MLNLFLPNKHVQSIYDITPTMLKELGIKGVVVDLDNTLVPWNVADATEEVRIWLDHLRKAGLNVFVFSNNNESRVKRFAEPLQIPYLANARKPLLKSFRYVKKKMGISPGQLAVIGDQVLTDVFGGNRFGAYTILVRPIVNSDGPATKINRQIEKLILNYFYRRGKLIRSVVDDEQTSM